MALGVFVLLIALSVRLSGELAWVVRVGLAVAYVAVSYVTLEPD